MKRSVPLYLFVSIIVLIFIIVSINFLLKEHDTHASSLPYYRNELQSEHTQYTFYVENEKNITALNPSTFVMQYSSAEKKNVPDTIKVTLDMLTMNCGTIVFSLRLNEHDEYVGEGIPVMKGTWIATATIIDNEEEASKLSFLFDVK